MRLMRWVIFLVLGPGLALASDLRPAEDPPADLVARQYIDSSGCVFLRDEAGGWLPRLSRDGSPICGYPPTLSARGLDGKPRLRALDPNAGRSRAELLEQALSETVLTNLRPGELANDPTPMETLPDFGPEPTSTAPVDALKAALAAAPTVRNNMGEALQPNRRLCQLLGYDDKAGASALGSDPSQGYCSTLPESDLSRLSFVRPLGEVRKADAKSAVAGDTSETAEKVAAPAKTGTQAKPPVASVPVPKKAATVAAADRSRPTSAKAQQAKTPDKSTAKSKAKATKQPAKPVVNTPKAAHPGPVTTQTPKAVNAAKTLAAPKAPAATASKPTAPASPGLIPPGARYVQFGTYADITNADRAAQVVARMGYPVMRGQGKVGGRNVQFILAGPFSDRETIVRALDSIRRAGFRDAYPR